MFYFILRKEVRNIKPIENIKVKIRNKLIEFIQQDKLERYLHEYINRSIKTVKDDQKTTSKDLYKRIDELSQSLTRLGNNVDGNQEDINILHNTIKSVVSVGADVYPNEMNRDRSWAVICIEGNYNIVKFIDMRGADYQNIMRYLKQFEGSRMVVDAPNLKYFESMFKF